MPKDNDWNNIFFSPDTRRVYIYADDVKSPPTWQTTFWSYGMQKAPQVANVWEKISTCGDTIATPVRQQSLALHRAIGAKDNSLQLDVMNPPLAPRSIRIFLNRERSGWATKLWISPIVLALTMRMAAQGDAPVL